MKTSIILGIFILSLTGCAKYHEGLNTANKGLDTANKETTQATEPLGKIWKLPSSMQEGFTKGYVDTPQENPYGR